MKTNREVSARKDPDHGGGAQRKGKQRSTIPAGKPFKYPCLQQIAGHVKNSI